jgi:hypothetical protein
MNEPQVWTLIGVFAASMVGVLTLVSTLFVNVVRSEVGGLRSEFRRFEDKLDNLDRDVQALMRHTFGIDRD